MISSSDLVGRSSSYGRLGGWLADQVETLNVGANSERYTEQLSLVSRLSVTHGAVAAVAASLLLCEYPIQVVLHSSDISQLSRASFPSLASMGVVKEEGGMRLSSLNKDFMKTAFPLKSSHPGATNKVNVYATEVLSDLHRSDQSMFFCVTQYLRSLAGKLYDDQLSALVLYAACLKPHFDEPVELAISVLLNPADAKGLSTALKAVGGNLLPSGAVLCEGNTLQGRGVAPADLAGEAAYRCSADDVEGSVAHFDSTALREVVRAILSEELEEVPSFETPAEVWKHRWAWCANGSHSRIFEAAHPQYGKLAIPGYTQWFRRMFAEAVKDEPVTGWDGEVFVSASPKLEHGKTRSIFACDSLCYFAFECLLRPVESVWRGRRVVLDPGRNGLVGMVQRVRALRKRGVISLMLDYDDFNSQHTLEAQKIVIEELGQAVGYNSDLLRTLVASFDKMGIYHAGKKVGTAKGTLMSGHRATTFLNSVLNAAYIRLGIGEDLYSQTWPLHVGDDVFMSAQHYSAAEQILARMGKTECRLNPAKQSTGSVGAEFLRTAITDRAAYGYAARSVSAVVSGNWVSEMQLGPREALATMVQSARTLMNRSQNWQIGALLVSGCTRMSRCGRLKVARLLRGEVALDAGPVFVSDGNFRWYETEVEEEDCDEDLEFRDLYTLATDDYLSHCATPAEVFAMTREGFSVKPAMVRSSYLKASPSGKPSTPRATLRGPHSRVAYGSIQLEDALKVSVRPGVLTKHPLLQLMRGRIRGPLLRELVALEGGNRNAPNIYTEAWGSEATGSVIQGILPYTDAASLSRKIYADVLIVRTPYYM